jgi:ubiquitin-conjugating enzyme E2 G1
MPPPAQSSTERLLAHHLKQMQSDKDIPGISCGLVDNSLYEWEVMLMINDDCKYYGGMSPSLLLFPFASTIR